jgi:hypothetical protein
MLTRQEKAKEQEKQLAIAPVPASSSAASSAATLASSLVVYRPFSNSTTAVVEKNYKRSIAEEKIISENIKLMGRERTIFHAVLTIFSQLNTPSWDVDSHQSDALDMQELLRALLENNAIIKTKVDALGWSSQEGTLTDDEKQLLSLTNTPWGNSEAKKIKKTV